MNLFDISGNVSSGDFDLILVKAVHFFIRNEWGITTSGHLFFKKNSFSIWAHSSSMIPL